MGNIDETLVTIYETAAGTRWLNQSDLIRDFLEEDADE